VCREALIMIGEIQKQVSGFGFKDEPSIVTVPEEKAVKLTTQKKQGPNNVLIIASVSGQDHGEVMLLNLIYNSLVCDRVYTV